MAHDITVAKQAEHDLRRLNEILEMRITERTAQLESSEAQMRAIFETSHQYQILLNLRGDVDGVQIWSRALPVADIWRVLKALFTTSR